MRTRRTRVRDSRLRRPGCGRAGLGAGAAAARQAADTLPDRLTDQEFWQLSQELSEPNGYFRSDNLVSNEIWLQWVIPDLLARSRPGGVYLGVGPEQNFTYIAALKPKMVFITDVRRGNLHMHLMYKALFEMIADRADFFAMLFNKQRPAGLTAKTHGDRARQRLLGRADVERRGGVQGEPQGDPGSPDEDARLPLGKDDLDGIEYVYWNFYWYGPAITYNSSTSERRAAAATWRSTAT